ncbi:TonB-dependent receptor [Bergeyella sp. RCAD1439]|uniref:TonB-dependent receptor n=1 Tax=Bergeyella anatis TaxID=3113737 RepID=UPI002E181ADF|nr:TonB-dependent receptor [Bergeyella sp. RCAD1439]
MKRVLCTVLFCASAFVFAQTGTLTGSISDDSKIAMPGAKLTLSPGNIYTTADENGHFVFLNVPSGKYTLTVDYIGYGRRQYPVTIVENRSTSQSVVFDTKVKTIETVAVVGFGRQSQARALNQQKNNPNITNVVSSDQVGKFPDSNIGDAMKRIPGITMQNDQGEARNIIVRGLAPELNSVTLNGNRIPSAEGDNRNVQMDLIPADMIQMIEVNKTLTSDMDGDAIGGSVELKTRTAPNKERLSLTTGSGYNGIRDRFAFTNAFMYGNRFAGGKLGVVLNGSYNNNDYGSDNVEGVWAQDDKGLYMKQMDIRKYDVKRERKSVGANFDFKINDKNALTLHTLYNWRDDWENRYRVRYRGITRNDDGTFRSEIRRQTKGGVNDPLNKGGRLERQIVQNYSLGGDHILGTKVDLNWGMSYSRAEEQRPNERYIDYRNRGAGRAGVLLGGDFSNTELPFISPLAEESLSDYSLREIVEQQRKTWEDEMTGRVNLRFPFSLVDGQKGRIRLGGKVRLKSKERENDYYDYKPTAAQGVMGTMADAQTVFWSGKGWNPDSKYIPGHYASKDYLGGLDLNNAALFTKTQLPEEFLALNYQAKENIYAGFVRFDQNLSDRLSFILGARIENTQTEYTGNLIKDEDSYEGSRTVKNTYTNILPSFALKYTPVSNMVLRAAFSTALARPNYYRLSPFISVIPGDDTILAGNPNLKVTYAYNYDVMGEYYFKNVGLFSLGGFYKKLNNFIYTYRDANYNYAKFAQDFPDTVNTLDPSGVYTLTTGRNGESVDVYGFETAFQRQLDFLPGFARNFGIYLNYTFTKSEAKGIYSDEGERRMGLMLPGTAPHMFNASLSWENKKFLTRLSLNHAAAYLDELGGNDFEDRYYDKQTFVDFNASYAIKQWMRVFVEANNLTNQPLRYYQGEASRTMQMEYYRARFSFGLKFDF